MDTKKAASFRNISVLKKLSSKFSFPPYFRKSIFGIRKKEKLPRPFETASLLAPYLCLLYELLHVFLLVPRATCRRHVLCFYVIPFHTFFSGMPSLFQLANPFLPCRFSGGGNAELLQEYPATSPIIVSSVFFLKVNNPFYVRWDPFIYPLGFDCQPSTVGRVRLTVKLPVKLPGPALLRFHHQVYYPHPGLCQWHRQPQTNPLHP